MGVIAATLAGMAIAGATTMGSAAISARGQKKAAEERGQGGVITMPQYSFTEPRLELASDFYSQQIQGLMEGKAPPYLDKYAPIMKEGLQRDLKQTFYGQPGRRSEGAAGRIGEAGAITGVGPKATFAGVSKAYQDYATKSGQIDQYISSIMFDATQQAAMTLPYQSMQMPKGPDAQVIGGQPQPAQPNYYGEALGDLAGNIPWENFGTTPGTAAYGGAPNTQGSVQSWMGSGMPGGTFQGGQMINPSAWQMPTTYPTYNYVPG